MSDIICSICARTRSALGRLVAVAGMGVAGIGAGCGNACLVNLAEPGNQERRAASAAVSVVKAVEVSITRRQSDRQGFESSVEIMAGLYT